MHVNLTVNDWKANGLSRRSLLEKMKNPKTQVSEAMRSYAAAATGGIETTPAKETALKAIKARMTAVKATHKGNTAFLAHVAKVEAGLLAEVNTLNTALNTLTFDTILATPALYTFFHAYCTNVEHNPEPLEFLHVAHTMAKPTLINTFIRTGSPKEVNVDASMRNALVTAPTSAPALKAICDDVQLGIQRNELPRFKKKYKIVL